MSSVNKVIILGNIGNLETKQNSSGEPICNISVATSESWKDKNTGEKQTKTEWHRIILFGNAAKFCSGYVTKGDKVYVEGKLTTRKWTDRQGIDKYTTEIIVDNFSGDLKIISSGTSKQDEKGVDEAEKAIDKHNATKINTFVEQEEEFLDEIPF